MVLHCPSLTCKILSNLATFYNHAENKQGTPVKLLSCESHFIVSRECIYYVYIARRENVRHGAPYRWVSLGVCDVRPAYTACGLHSDSVSRVA